MTFWLLIAAGVVLAWISGYATAVWCARWRADNARGGYVVLAPRPRVENWCCPDKPYDQDADLATAANMAAHLAAHGNPLVVDTLNVQAIQRELGNEAAAIAAGIGAVQKTQR